MDYSFGPLLFEDDSKHVHFVEEYQLPEETLDTEFKRKYLPDTLGDELESGARVWQVFRDEASTHDSSMLDGWNKTLDILLIFAGLFSAVVTAFLIESYKFLQPDNGDYAAAALYALVIAANNSAILENVPSPSSSPFTTAVSRGINGLWFTSLFVALSVAFLCILAKQWLAEYVARNAASAKHFQDWARRRMFFFRGLTAWRLPELLSILPLLLHLSLFLFFSGVTVLLWVLDIALGIMFGAFSLLLFGFYVTSILLPLWKLDCPTATPLVGQIQQLWVKLKPSIFSFLLYLVKYVRIKIRKNPVPLLPVAEASPAASPASSSPQLCRSTSRLDSIVSQLDSLSKPSDVQLSTNGLSAVLKRNEVDLDVAALHWIILGTSNNDAIAVGLQALGPIMPWSPLYWPMHSLEIQEYIQTGVSSFTTSGRMGPIEAIRVGLAVLHIHMKDRYDDYRISNELENILVKIRNPLSHLLSLAYGKELPLWYDVKEFWLSVPQSVLFTTTAVLIQKADKKDWVVYLLCALTYSDMSDTQWEHLSYVLRKHPLWAKYLWCSHEATENCGRHCIMAFTMSLLLKHNAEDRLDRDSAEQARMLIDRHCEAVHAITNELRWYDRSRVADGL